MDSHIKTLIDEAVKSLEPTKKNNIPKYVLGLLSIFAATALTVIEIESIEGESIGLTLAIIVFNYAGVAIFWIAGDLTKKQHRYGREAFAMSIAVRVITFAYIVWMGAYEIVTFHQCGQMFATNMLLLFMEIMMNRYSDGSEEYLQKIKAVRNMANAWEKQSNEAESKRMQAESKANDLESKLKANNEIIKALQEEKKEIESKLNACQEAAKEYERLKPVIELFIDTTFTIGNVTHYIDSVSRKGYTFGRGVTTIETDTGKKVNK